MNRKDCKMNKTLAEQQAEPLAISLKSLADRLDAHRSSVRRWLREAGIQPLAVGRGVNGAIRYSWPDVQVWLNSLEKVD